MAWMLDRFARAGLSTDHGPNVSRGCERGQSALRAVGRIVRASSCEGDVLLIDLWATEPDGIYADQTWMATIGAPSGARAGDLERRARRARRGDCASCRRRPRQGEPVRGADVDDAARKVIESRGFGEYFTHRTGHSIDPRSLHGSGPHLDNLETREERLLIPGVGFSIEPGIYIPGEIGMRTEVNVFIEPRPRRGHAGRNISGS